MAGWGNSMAVPAAVVLAAVLLMVAAPAAATSRDILGSSDGSRSYPGRTARELLGGSGDDGGWAAASPAKESQAELSWEPLDNPEVVAMMDQTAGSNSTAHGSPGGNDTFLVCFQNGENNTRCEEVPASEEMLESLISDSGAGSLFSEAGRMQAVAVVFLAACAGCTGCGLILTCLTGVIALTHRAALSHRQQQAHDEPAGGHAVPQARAAGTPPKPVVIVTPTNDVLVGFEVKVPRAEATSAESPGSGRIAVDPSASPARPSAAASHLPRHLLMSPLAWHRQQRREELCDPGQQPAQPVSPPRPSVLSPSRQAHVVIGSEADQQDGGWSSGAGSSQSSGSP